MVTVSSRWPRLLRLRGPMITAQSRLGEVTAQSRRGHSSVTARSQLCHSSITASSVWSRLSHGKVTAQSRPRSRLSHGWLWPFWSRWAHGGQFFSHGKCSIEAKISDRLSHTTLKFYGRPWKTTGHLFYALSSFVHHFIAVREFKLELQSGNTPFR